MISLPVYLPFFIYFFGQKPFFINEIRKETDRVQQVPILQSNRLYDCDHG